MIEDSATTKSYYLRPCSDTEMSEGTDGIGVGTPETATRKPIHLIHTLSVCQDCVGSHLKKAM